VCVQFNLLMFCSAQVFLLYTDLEERGWKVSGADKGPSVMSLQFVKIEISHIVQTIN